MFEFLYCIFLCIPAVIKNPFNRIPLFYDDFLNSYNLSQLLFNSSLRPFMVLFYIILIFTFIFVIYRSFICNNTREIKIQMEVLVFV